MKKIVRTMEQLKELVGKSQVLSEKKKRAYILKLDELIGKYDQLPETKGSDALYNTMIDNGIASQVELKKSKPSRLDIEAKTGYFLRVAAASYYDYSGQGGKVETCIRTVMWMSAMGLVVASMVYGVIGTIILIIPIIFALLKMKKRDSIGIVAAFVVMAGSVMASALWLYYLIRTVIPNWDDFVANAVTNSHVPYAIATIMASLTVILPFAVIALVILTVIVLKKYKDMFI